MNFDDTSKTNEFSRTIASRIRQERERRAWTQNEVAEYIGTTRITITRWENATTIPSPYYRQRLAKLFEKTVQELGFTPESDEASLPSFWSASDTHPSPTLLPLCNVPHRRNSFFTGREEILASLYATFRCSQTVGLTQALIGLGGIGKTQVAIEYAYRYRDTYEGIFWVGASSKDTLKAGFVTLATLLNFPEQQEQDQDIIVQAVKHWLSNHRNWLLILDNVDQVEMINDFLPTHITGDVLLTTRQQALGIIAHGIEVEKMSLDEGILFLLFRTKMLTPGGSLDQATKESQAQAAKIVEALEGLPLALDQAGAYIEETHCGLSQYLDLYSTHRKELLLRRGGGLPGHPESVAATWQLSFKQIEENSRAAIELLHFCSFLNADAIPEELLTIAAFELGPILQVTVSDPLKLNGVLQTLRAYSLIRRSPETRELTIHRLVQEVLRQSLSSLIQRQWAERVIRTLHRAFPKEDNAPWTLCERLLPQVQTCVQLFDEYDLLLPEAGHLFIRAGSYASIRALHTQAEMLFQRALALYEQVFSSEHPEVAIALKHLAELYRTQGRYQEAEQFLRRALAICQRSQSSGDSTIVFILNNLGELCHNLGRYQEAEQHLQQALVIYQLNQSPADLAIVPLLNNLGELYRTQGRYEEAEPLFQRALSMTEHILGPDHPNTATALYYLAALYHSQERDKEAEHTYKQVLVIRTQLFGEEHFRTAAVMNDLARLYRSQGRYSEAEVLLQRSLLAEEKMLGSDHPHTAIILQNLAVIYQKQEQYKQAEALYQRALAIKEASRGIEHLSAEITMTNLAHLYQMQKRYTEAEELYQRALTSGLEQNHPYTLIILTNLGRLYYQWGHLEKAEDCYLQALAFGERALPAQYPAAKRTLKSLAELYYAQGRKEEAVLVEQRVFTSKSELLRTQQGECEEVNGS